MFYPFKVKSELKSGESSQEFLRFRAELTSNFDSYAQQQNEEQSKINLRVVFKLIVL